MESINQIVNESNFNYYHQYYNESDKIKLTHGGEIGRE